MDDLFVIPDGNPFEITESEKEDKITISIEKQVIVDLFCLHGEAGVGSLGSIVGNLLAEQIGYIIKNISEEDVEKRQKEIFEIIKEKKNARNKSE